MKKNSLYAALIVCVLLPFWPEMQAQKREQKDADFQAMVELIESGTFEFRVQSVNPTGRQTMRPTTVYTMVAKDGRFIARLPYFGRVFQPSYGGDGGIEFDGEPEELAISKNEKKRTLTLTCVMRGDNERFNLTLAAGSNGYGNLSITTTKRQAISYYGSISQLEEK
jgi:hypothetical protein